MKTKLLLVEDDDAVHCALAEVLQGENYEVLHAFSPTEALLTAERHDDLGLVLLDLNLRGENGWDVFEHLTRMSPTLPILILTARSDQRALAEAAGAGALMEKPLNIPHLLELIAALIAEPPAACLARLTGHASSTSFAHSTPSRLPADSVRTARASPASSAATRPASARLSSDCPAQA